MCEKASWHRALLTLLFTICIAKHLADMGLYFLMVWCRGSGFHFWKYFCFPGCWIEAQPLCLFSSIRNMLIVANTEVICNLSHPRLNEISQIKTRTQHIHKIYHTRMGAGSITGGCWIWNAPWFVFVFLPSFHVIQLGTKNIWHITNAIMGKIKKTPTRDTRKDN